MRRQPTSCRSFHWPVIVTALAFGLFARVGWTSGETVNLGLGNLDPGQTVTITFDVTVDSRPPDFTQVCNQGVVSATNHSNQLTDDPAAGGTVDPTCTAVPAPPGGKVTLLKSVVNNNGGTASVNDFGMTLGGTTVNSGAALNFAAGSVVAIDEAGLTGYSFVSITGTGCPAALGGTVTVNVGDDIVCTITNDDIQPTLKVIKTVVNNDGGTAVAADFTMDVSGTNVSSTGFPGDTAGTTVTLDAGSYSVTESGPSGYMSTLSTDCAGTIGVGENLVCTVTNDDEPVTGSIVIVEDTFPDGPQDFSFSTTGGLVPAGFDLDDDADGTLLNSRSYTNVAAGFYSVTQASVVDYTTALNCVDSSGGTMTAGAVASINLAPGETVTCTFSNSRAVPPIAVLEPDSFIYLFSSLASILLVAVMRGRKRRRD